MATIAIIAILAYLALKRSIRVEGAKFSIADFFHAEITSFETTEHEADKASEAKPIPLPAQSKEVEKD
ncbi:MAG: hypothetical protein QM758_09080 [Armatimonas sp.]